MIAPSAGARLKSSRRLLLISGIVLGMTGCGVSTAPPATPTPVQGILGGATVYRNDFTDATGGWFVGQTAEGTSFTIDGGGYVVTSHHNAVTFTAAHYGVHLTNVAIDVGALVQAGNPTTATSGAWCFQGDGPPRDHVYMFMVLPDQHFEIRRYDNAVTKGIRLAAGRSPLLQGLGTVNPLTAVCRTLGWDGDRAHNQVLLAVGGAIIADVADTWAGQPRLGWGTGLLTGGDDAVPTTVRFTHYRLRDLTGS